MNGKELQQTTIKLVMLAIEIEIKESELPAKAAISTTILIRKSKKRLKLQMIKR
jgi:hypothetical protein